MPSKSWAIVSLFLLFLTVFSATSAYAANFSDWEYEGGGLEATEQQKGNTNPGNYDGGAGNIGDPDSEKSWWERILDGGKELFGKVKDGTVDAINGAVACVQNASQCVEVIGTTLSAGWDAVSDWASSQWDKVKDWWNNLPDIVQDLIKTIGAIALVVAGVVALVFAGVISAVVAIVAAVAAVIGGLAHFAFFGGTEDFSFMGALIWSLAGALTGGVLSYSGAGAAIWAVLRTGTTMAFRSILTGMASRLAPILAAARSAGGIINGLKAALTAFWATGWGKAIVFSNAITVMSHMMNFLATGDKPGFGEFVSDMVVSTATGLLGYASLNRLLPALRSKSFADIFAWVEVNALAGGMANTLLQYVSDGVAGLADFLVGAGVGIAFILPDIGLKKLGISDSFLTGIYEYSKKALSGAITNLTGAETNGVHSTPAEMGRSYNAVKGEAPQHLSPSLDPVDWTTDTHLADQEAEALSQYLDSLHSSK